jgi:hypothetical protein
MPPYDWQGLMQQWNTALLNSTFTDELPGEAIKAGWLGKSGATEAELAEMEKRLGKALPLSYREFLQFSNGWQVMESFGMGILSTDEVGWFRELSQGWMDAWCGIDGLTHECAVMRAALQVSDRPDVMVMMLNPNKINADGEWQAVNLFDSEWTEYDSFWDMMQDEWKTFQGVERSMVVHNQQEAAFNGVDAREKISAALEVLREAILLQEQTHSGIPDFQLIYPQGILTGLRYAEEKLVEMQSLPSANIPERFKALMEDLQNRHNEQHGQGMQGLDLMGALSNVMSGKIGMNDLTDMVNRLGMVSAGQGYLQALQILQRVHF